MKSNNRAYCDGFALLRGICHRDAHKGGNNGIVPKQAWFHRIQIADPC